MASNTYEMTGTVKTIFEPMTFASGFTKREFLLTMEDDYPQDVKFSCVKERAAQLDNVTLGERVSVAFRVRCREWQGKYFVDLEAFRIALQNLMLHPDRRAQLSTAARRRAEQEFSWEAVGQKHLEVYQQALG